MAGDASPASGRPHVHYVFMRFPAPSEAFARVELSGLRSAGCAVSVSTLRTPRGEPARLLEEHSLEDLPVSYAGVSKWLRGLVGLCSHPGAAWRVARTLLPALAARPGEALLGLALLPRAFGIALETRRGSADQVHLFWGHYPCLVGLVLKELDEKAPVSMFLGAYDLVRGFPPSRSLAARVPVTTHARANVPAICAFTGLSPGEVAVIHRGVRVPPLSVPGRRAAPPRVVVAERLVPEKHTAEALEVFRRVARSVPDAVLTVLGDGPERARLERQAGEHGLGSSVHYRGHVPHEAVQAELSRSHVLLSMSQSPGERLPNIVKEAMAAGCAAVVTRSPGIEELVADGQTGCLVEAGAVEEAAARLAGLLGDDRQRAALARRARETIESDFDIAVTTRQRLRFWFPDDGDGGGH